ncbi:MAG: helix-turn-helix domain-containing protein [Caldilineaceae bacterium]
MSRDLVVGLCDPGNDPFWLQVKDAIYQTARRLGIQLVPIDSSVPGDAQGPAAQLAVVEELLALELHAVVNWGWPEQLALPVLEAGLPIIHLSETAVSHPLAASPLGLYDVAWLAADHLSAHLRGAGHVLVVGGLCQPGLPDDGRSRLAGVDAAFARYPGIHYTHTGSTWNATARPVIEAAVHDLAGPPAGIIALSDSLALMAAPALYARGFAVKEVPLAEQIPIVGINGDPIALAAITRGEMLATVETDPYVLGEQAVELAYLAAQHRPLPVHYSFTYQLITAQNVAAVASNRLLATAALPSHLVEELGEISQQRRLQLQTSLAVSHRIGSLLDPDALVQEVTDIIRTHYGYDRAFLYSWDPERQALQPAGTPRAPSAISGQVLAPSGPLAQALFGDEAIFIPNTRRSLRFAEDPLWPDIHARVVLPVRLGGTVVGLLDLHCTQPSLHLGREQLTELIALAGQLGIAMQNAQLYRRQSEIRTAAEKMESAKTQFMANVSHELRSALTGILVQSTALSALHRLDEAAAQTLAIGLARIRITAADLIKLTGDLLDLAQVEVGSPALAPVLVDLRALLVQLVPRQDDLQLGNLQLPPRLPLVSIDLACLRQGFDALLDHIRRVASAAPASVQCLAAGAAVDLPLVHVWLRIGSAGTTPAAADGRRSWESELGLTLARRFFALIGGSLTVEAEAADSLSFHIRLPLPTLADLPAGAESRQSPLLVIASAGDGELPDPALTGSPLCRLQNSADLDTLLQEVTPGALLWDAAYAAAADWELLLAVRQRRELQHLPFLLYPPIIGLSPGLSGEEIDLAAPVRGQSLTAAIAEFCPATASKSVLIVEPDRTLCRTYTSLVERSLPGVPVAVAASAAAAAVLLRQTTPGLMILETQLEDRDGLELVEQLRAAHTAPDCPVLLLTCRPLEPALLARLAHLGPILYAGKSIFMPDELASLVARAFSAPETLSPRTGDLVKQAIFYIQQHFDQPLNRADVADAISVSENYLSQIFRQEMGISLWDYLNRQRISHAQHLLESTTISVTGVAVAVGIYDPAYFSRIFHKQTGLSPSAYRVAAQRPASTN